MAKKSWSTKSDPFKNANLLQNYFLVSVIYTNLFYSINVGLCGMVFKGILNMTK